MPATPRLPLLKRIPPGVWTAVIWCAGLALTMLMRFRLPGQEEADAYRTVLLSSAKWEGWTLLALGTALTLGGCVLMRRRPLWALALMLAGSIAATSALSVGASPARCSSWQSISRCTSSRRPGHAGPGSWPSPWRSAHWPGSWPSGF